MPPKGKIPDRWIPYKACGDVIEGTRLICFKVPLHKNVQQRVPGITKIWDIPAVLSEIPKLGAVIDLTNTARYYNPKEFLAANVLHRKILMPGREIPPEAKVQEFMAAVDEFLGKDCVAVQVRRARRSLSTADTLVGVHCTHGLNRTGYMVCRYMRDRLNIPAQDAIERFEKARGYQIEREIYKAGLLNNALPPPDFGQNNSHGWRNNQKKKSAKRKWSESQKTNESQVGNLVESLTSNADNAEGRLDESQRRSKGNATKSRSESQGSHDAQAPNRGDESQESYNANAPRSRSKSQGSYDANASKSWRESQRSYKGNAKRKLDESKTSCNLNATTSWRESQRNNNESTTKTWREIQNERRVQNYKKQCRNRKRTGIQKMDTNITTNNDNETKPINKKQKVY